MNSAILLPPKVAIIILNWNNSLETISCLESISRLKYPNYEVFVIDNGSDEDDGDLFQSCLQGINFVRVTENKGYTGGNNLGILAAKLKGAEYFWLLNNDARVMENTLDVLIAFCDKYPGHGLISPMVLDDESTQIGYVGTKINIETQNRTVIYGSEHEAIQESKLFLWGTAMLISQDVIESIGFLDERFFAYYEDYDYSMRALIAGFQNYIVPEAKIYHPSKSSSSARPEDYYHFYNSRNEFLFWKKTLSLKAYRTHRKRLLSKFIVRSSNFISEGQTALAKACLEGVFNALIGRYGNWEKRSRLPVGVVKLLTSHPYFLSALLFGRPITRLSK